MHKSARKVDFFAKKWPLATSMFFRTFLYLHTCMYCIPMFYGPVGLGLPGRLRALLKVLKLLYLMQVGNTLVLQ